MEALFAKYITLLRRNGLSWVIEENLKIAVKHVCDAIQPKLLRKRLESDLGFSHVTLRKDFKAFRKHAIRRDDTFQLADNGKQSSADGDTKREKRQAQPSENGKVGSATRTKD